MIDNSNKKKISEGFTRLSEPMLADKEQLKCDYYRRTKHTRKTSWQLHGHPSRGWGGKRIGFPRSQALVSKITRTLIPDGQSNTSTLSKKEIQTLRHQMAKLDPPSLSNFAHVGMPMIAFNSSTISDSNL
jgi:hypothetical protein